MTNQMASYDLSGERSFDQMIFLNNKLKLVQCIQMDDVAVTGG